MHSETLSRIVHDHGHEPASQPAERRSRWVLGLTIATMGLELAAGWMTGSLALLADGWHMATHAGVIALSVLAYWFARTRAASGEYTFGTGKVHALAGYTSALALGGVAAWMVVEAVERLRAPVPVRYDEALLVAAIGLAVNLASIRLLASADGRPHGHGHGHGQAPRPAHGHGHDHGAPHGHGHGTSEPGGDAGGSELPDRHDGDHNLRGIYLHVLADALTSVLAIAALLAGRQLGWAFLDPAIAALGGALILRWAGGLVRDSSRALLDATPSAALERRVRAELEAIDDVRVADLHLWQMGPGRRGGIVSLVTSTPRDTEHYRARILGVVPLAHLTVEIYRCPHEGGDCA